MAFSMRCSGCLVVFSCRCGSTVIASCSLLIASSACFWPGVIDLFRMPLYLLYPALAQESPAFGPSRSRFLSVAARPGILSSTDTYQRRIVIIHNEMINVESKMCSQIGVAQFNQTKSRLGRELSTDLLPQEARYCKRNSVRQTLYTYRLLQWPKSWHSSGAVLYICEQTPTCPSSLCGRRTHLAWLVNLLVLKSRVASRDLENGWLE